VVLLNVGSLFWPRLEPADENSFYQRCVTFLSSAARITSEDATISKPLFVAQSTPTNLEELLKLGRNAFTDSRYVHEQIPSRTDFDLNGG